MIFLKNALNLMKYKKKLQKNWLVMFCAGQNRSTKKYYKFFIAKYVNSKKI